ncbi:hypothetical protein D3C76_1683740 [compost metagenome]
MFCTIVRIIRYFNVGISVKISHVIFVECTLREEQNKDYDGDAEQCVCSQPDGAAFLFDSGSFIFLHMT